jgi:hypothetical protein
MGILLMADGWKSLIVVTGYCPVEDKLIRAIPAALSIGMRQYITGNMPRSFHWGFLHK